jgi:uncharacterized membrane protein
MGGVNMSQSSKSILVFGAYMVLLGIVLILAPNLLLGIFGIQPTTEVWIRVLGVIVGIFGCYYIVAARSGLKPFFRATVYGRTAVLLSFVAFTILGLMKPVIILFGMIDFLGAIWTALVLRAEST